MMGPAVAKAVLDSRVFRLVFWPTLAILAGVGLTNAMTLLADQQRRGGELEWGQPWILEFSSVSVLALLVPLVIWFASFIRLKGRGWLIVLPAYLCASAVFSGLHVLIMVVLRKLTFWALWGQSYVFFSDPLNALFYEYRKDLLPFAATAVLCYFAERLVEGRVLVPAEPVSSNTGRVELRLGKRTIWVEGSSFEWANAAGNYVEVSAGGVRHLARASLSDLEASLKAAGVAVVRVHRSRIVNRDSIREVRPTRAGDFVIRLFDGTELRGSRRYRSMIGE